MLPRAAVETHHNVTNPPHSSSNATPDDHIRVKPDLHALNVDINITWPLSCR